MNVKLVRFTNLTPHDVRIIGSLGECVKAYPKSHSPARVSQKNETHLFIDGIPLYKATFGEVIDLPEKQENVLLIVSALVKSACSHRDDLVSPGELVRDYDGNIIGCKGFIYQ